MKIKGVLWDNWNIEHMARHGVSQSEAEELVNHPQLKRRTRNGCYAIYGQTDFGRYLVVIVAPRAEGMVYVVTARDMVEREKRWTKKRK